MFPVSSASLVIALCGVIIIVEPIHGSMSPGPGEFVNWAPGGGAQSWRSLMTNSLDPSHFVSALGGAPIVCPLENGAYSSQRMEAKIVVQCVFVGNGQRNRSVDGVSQLATLFTGTHHLVIFISPFREV